MKKFSKNFFLVPPPLSKKPKMWSGGENYLNFLLIVKNNILLWFVFIIKKVGKKIT